MRQVGRNPVACIVWFESPRPAAVGKFKDVSTKISGRNI